MNSASTDLQTHLEVLRQKLTHPSDYDHALRYFMDEFSGDLGFHAEGTPDPAPHLRAGLKAVISKVTGQPGSIDELKAFFLHAHDFFHGHAHAGGTAVIFFYFAKINLGLANLIWFSDGNHQVVRFQLPEPVAGNPGYN
jgi:hypothetical protein